MDETDQPQLGIGQIETMPCFENVLNAFSLDQCARKHCAKFSRLRTWLKALHIHSARQVEQLFLWKPADAKGLCRLFG